MFSWVTAPRLVPLSGTALLDPQVAREVGVVVVNLLNEALDPRG
jgi:hypothetical protein